MGQGNSSGAGSGSAQGPPLKTCYYESLGVSQQATDDEIKKAHRRKALELHPDRNYGNVEATTAQFADVQAAYEVLSDPQERAWYDSHRAAILRGETGAESDGGEVWEGSVRVTTAEDITKLYLNFDGRLDFSDASTGFFAQLRQFFEKLADEEVLAEEPDDSPPPGYPSFGTSTDSHDGGVRQFYSAWGGFSTRKSFAWKDIYRLSGAPDRRTRRLMEKENGRLRSQGIKEFNEAVKALVSFVRKRDPRYAPNNQSEEQRQKALRDRAAEQAARDRAANQAAAEAYVLPEWARGDAAKDGNEGGFEESEEEVEHVLECVVCSKMFKSESQFEAHEKSKKHKKAVFELEKLMRKENKELGLDMEQKGEGADAENGEAAIAEDGDEAAEDKTDHPLEETEGPEPSSPAPPSPKPQPSHPNSASSEPPSDAVSAGSGDSDYAPRAAVEARLSATNVDSTADDPSTDLHSSGTQTPKLGAAKLKRQKKDAAASATREDSSAEAFRCTVCQAGFPSKTKLFAHISESGHARAVPAGLGGGGGGVGKKKKKTGKNKGVALDL